MVGELFNERVSRNVICMYSVSYIIHSRRPFLYSSIDSTACGQFLPVAPVNFAYVCPREGCCFGLSQPDKTRLFRTPRTSFYRGQCDARCCPHLACKFIRQSRFLSTVMSLPTLQTTQISGYQIVADTRDWTDRCAPANPELKEEETIRCELLPGPCHLPPIYANKI